MHIPSIILVEQELKNLHVPVLDLKLVHKLQALNVDYTKLFRTEHLQSRKILIAKINELLKTSTDEELKTIYKIVFGCID